MGFEYSNIRIAFSLDLDQADALSTSLDILSRLGCGQIDILNDFYKNLLCIDPYKDFCFVSFDTIIKQAKSILGFAPGEHLGVVSKRTSQCSKSCWMINNEIKKKILCIQKPYLKQRVLFEENYNELFGFDSKEIPKVKILKEDTMSDKLHLEVTLEQAAYISQALDVFARLGIGQINIVDELHREGFIPHLSPSANIDYEAFCDVMKEAKHVLGFGSGASLGIMNERVPKGAVLSWVVKKEIDQKIAMHKDPNPDFKGVNYDGNNLNLMKIPEDELPRAKIVEKKVVSHKP